MLTKKLKNKFLIALVLVVLVSVNVGALSTLVGNYLFYSAEFYKNRIKNNEKAIEFFDELIEKYPDHPKIPEALYNSALIIPDTNYATGIFFQDYSSASRVLSDWELPSLALSKEERLRTLLDKFPEHPLQIDAKYHLAEILKNKGNLDQAYDLYWDFVFSRSRSYQLRQQAAFTLIELCLMKDKPETAEMLFKYAETFLIGSTLGLNSLDRQMLYGVILLAKGDIEGAAEAYDKALEIYLSQSTGPLRAFTSPSYPLNLTAKYQKEVANKFSSFFPVDTENVVKGQVTLNGKPFPWVEVVLWTKPSNHIGVPDERVLLSFFTNSKGQFQFAIEPNREYEVGIKLNSAQMGLVQNHTFEILNNQFYSDSELKDIEFNFREPVKLKTPEPKVQIENKPFTVEWEPYAGASFYCVMIDPIYRYPTGTTTMTGGAPFYTEQTSITFEEIPFTLGIISGDNKGTHHGYFLTPDAIQIRVVACDTEGKVLADNKGFNFGKEENLEFVYEVAKELEEEILITDRRFDEAITKLDNRLQINPNDIYALNLLSRIYYAGTDYLDESLSSKAHVDKNRALEMQERLVALKPTSQNVRNLGHLYRNLGSPKRYEPYLLLESRGTLLPSDYKVLAEYALGRRITSKRL